MNKHITKFNILDIVRSQSDIITLVILFIIASTICGKVFIRSSNLVNILSRASILGVIALGQTLVILTAGIDLSVAANLGLYIAVNALLTRLGMDPLVAMIVALIFPIIVGFINGSLCAYTRIPPFIVTLGMMMILASVKLAVIGTHATEFPEIQSFFFRLMAYIPSVDERALPIFVCAIILIFFTLLLRYSRLGYNIYAVGGSQIAAKFSGIDIKFVKISVYTLSGFLTGIAALLLIIKLGGVNPVAGKEFLLESIAATVIGGTSLNGGEGKLTGTVVGAITISILVNMMNLKGVNPFLQDAIIGGIFIIFVYTHNLIHGFYLLRKESKL